MAMCSSGIPLKFILFSLQLIEKVLETSVEKQTYKEQSSPQGHGGSYGFLKDSVADFRKKVKRTASYFIFRFKKVFFFQFYKASV